MVCIESGDLLEQLLAGGLRNETLLHVAECPICEGLLAQLRTLVESLHGFRAAQPPPQVLQRAVSLVPQPGLMRRWLDPIRAWLVLDSAALSPVPVRSQSGTVGATAGRFLRFEHQDWVAEIHSSPTETGRHDLAGQLLESEAEAPFAVVAYGTQGQSFPRFSDELGRFHFPDLPADSYRLHLELDTADLVLEPIQLA